MESTGEGCYSFACCKKFLAAGSLTCCAKSIWGGLVSRLGHANPDCVHGSEGTGSASCVCKGNEMFDVSG